MLEGLTYLDGVPDEEMAKLWITGIEKEYPDYSRSEDTAVCQIVCSLTMTLGGFDLILCRHGNKLIGLLAYKIEKLPDRIELFNFAVLPTHQRNGIGVALLKLVQGKARGKLPIFASGINKQAFVPLQRAGFWKVKDRGDPGNTTYKWSDLPEHKNDETPFTEGEDGK